MSGQIIEIATNGRSVHLERGFLSIRDKGTTIGKIALSDVGTVISSSQGVMWSSHAITALLENGASIVIVGEKFIPSAYLVSTQGHHDQGRRFRAQADASLPKRKRLWANIVKAKILAQADVLSALELPSKRLEKLAATVRSGDPTNREAAAAQLYWPMVMGNNFRRKHNDNINAMLNYGYTVLRSSAARAIVAAGLHPSLSLKHVSDGSAFCLADDIMEPFRPAVDLLVYKLEQNSALIEDRDTKAALANIVNSDYLTSYGRTPLSHVLVRFCQDLSSVFMNEKEQMDFPYSRLPVVQFSNDGR